ncbi:VWA domain-containing protein [Mycobacterium sp. M1]|uniref:VWA domain-containing protein n=1 Tax=Mycolicibacter acidiphilus TaxID=2835306 RepID=A0ABS5RNL6_9MYCO|nr:VWA domain-containing protein [Mycolicibacter acidiphilus]MBS9535895.1 VWA domain-containing protein [Mycolicibacter acidiphilus]
MANRLWPLLIAVAVLVSGCNGDVRDAARTTGQAPVPTVLILDASGSMNETDAPGPRIDAAKHAAQELIDGLPDGTAAALLAYGTGTGSAEAEKPAGCQDVKVLIPMGPVNHQQMAAQIAGLRASGYTPIDLALRTAVSQLPVGDMPQSIILVSDGEDTCGAPPCDTAREAVHRYPNITISTVGFKTDGTAGDQLRCIAEVTGGLFVTAQNAGQLSARLLATRDLDQAQNSLSANGIGDLTLGTDLPAIRSAHPDFPDASATGSVVVVYRDCDFGFVDGTLDSIAPHDGGRTIDGVAPGTPLSRAVELYGDAVKTESDGHGGYQLTFAADPATGSGYRIVADAYSESGGAVAGTVGTIVLCRCAPRAAEPAPPAPVPVDASPFADSTGYGYYFVTPSGKWVCGILKAEAGCNGPNGKDFVVAGTPLVPSNDDQRPTAPNTILVDSQSARFDSTGDAHFYRLDGVNPDHSRTLEYGQTLSASGFTCNVQRIGVSCRNDATGNGFTFSSTGYRFEYTPVP